MDDFHRRILFMKKNAYLITLVIITVCCVIAGSCWHIFKWGFSFMESFVPFVFSESDKERPGSLSSKGTQLDEFTSISADVSIMDIDIVSGDEYSISYSAHEKLVPKFEVKNSCLEITQNPKKLWGNKTCSVTITVPEELSGVYLDMSVGDIDITGITASSLEIDTSVGDLDISDCKFGDADVDASTGDIDFLNTVFDRLEIDASVGDVQVDAAENLSDYKIELDTGIGDVEVNGRDYKDCFYQNAAEDGRKSLTVDTSTGDIELNY